jgi:hypothetical protein
MGTAWYRQKAADIGRSARVAATEKERKILENDQRNWLLIADRIDENEAAITLRPKRVPPTEAN